MLEGDGFNQIIWSFPLGVTLSRTFETAGGWRVKPSLDLRVTPNAGDVESRVGVRFTGVSEGCSMRSQTMDYVTYGGTAGLELGRGSVKLNMNYSLEAGERSTQHGVYATFRYEF